MTKQPKRTIRANIYGNLVGYEGGRRVKEFGDAYTAGNKRDAAEWLEEVEFASDTEEQAQIEREAFNDKLEMYRNEQ